MPRSGTLVICVQNLDFSGANQTVLHIVNGRMHESNVIVLSPKIGSFAARYVESGAAVRIGDLPTLLDEIRDVFCIICNTIMTADVVVDVSKRPHPVIWIIHEWWDDEMIVQNLKIRNMSSLTLQTVKEAFNVASMIIFVCESQRRLYKPNAPSTVIFVGVPKMGIANQSDKSPAVDQSSRIEVAPEDKIFTVLVLGIVCPRKNQLWAIKLFKKFAQNHSNVQLLIVGARYTRSYEVEYVEKLRKEKQDDPRIEIIDVTSDVDQYYAKADCLLVTSINEVTPMVIPEAMCWGIPILSTNIAGIPEMFTHGIEGYQFDPFDDEAALAGMKSLYDSPLLRQQMGCAGKIRYAEMFDLEGMVDRYRQVVFDVAPPVVLLDMDGTIVDWDQGFLDQWNNRSYIDRGKSYRMEECVDPQLQAEAVQMIHSKGLFENLPPMEGAIAAINEMSDIGLKVYICTAPIMKSAYCAQEKINWVRKYLGDDWLEKLIMTVDKTTVRGDLLIDDKPFECLSPGGKHTTATWKQVIFDAPYNQEAKIPRLKRWSDWKSVVLPLLGKSTTEDPYLLEYGECLLPRVALESPRSRRQRDRDSGELAERAEFVKESFLNGLTPTPLSPSEVASIAGSGSFLMEEPSPRSWMATDSSFTFPSKETKIDEEMKDERMMLDAEGIQASDPISGQARDNVSRIRQAYRLFRIQSNQSQDRNSKS